MESGIARKIDDLGRIVIPAETRRLFNLHEGDHLTIAIDGESIVLRKVEDSCVFCGQVDGLTRFKERPVCGSCRDELAAEPIVFG